MKNLLVYIYPVLLGVLLTSCQRDDDEPLKVTREISRLYVSTSDYQANSNTNFHNVWAIDPVDSNDFPEISKIYKFTSAALGGNTIHYSPVSNGLLFQSSVNSPVFRDTAIQVMTISRLGVITNSGLIGNRMYDKVRGMHYTVVVDGMVSQDFLLAVNVADTVNLFAFDKPRNNRGFTKPRFRMELDFNPWAILVNGYDLMMSKAESDGGIVVYKDYTKKLLNEVDTVIQVAKSFELNIAGAHNIRGMSYSKAKDILVLTDYVGEGVATEGRILVIEKFSTFSTNAEITPSRIIKSSKLVQPLDVAIDPRPEGKFLYVADPVARRVFRFSIDDDGLVNPNQELNLMNRAPQSLSLDAR